MDLDFTDSRLLGLGIEPYHGDADKVECYRWLVNYRIEWLTTLGDGSQELCSELEFDVIEQFVPALKQSYESELIKLTDAGEFHLMARLVITQAEKQAHRWARQHIDEVWANRRERDYVPPWEQGNMAGFCVEVEE